MAGAVPELAAGSVGSAHHLWVGRVAFGWLLWIAWQTGLLYDDNDIKVCLPRHGLTGLRALEVVTEHSVALRWMDKLGLL